VVTLSNANSVEFSGRPADFYAAAEGGLKPVSLGRPDSVSSTVAARCECGVKVTLINGVLEAPCPGCGKVVKILKP
jgi:hypothetical protein